MISFFRLDFFFFFPAQGASPRKRLFGVGATGWRALRWRWAWPVARAGGAVARRPPSSLAARAEPGSPGARNGPPGPEDGAEAAEEPCDHRDPRPERLARRAGAEVLVVCF